MLDVPVNNFPVMLGRSQHFLGITSTLTGGGGGKYVLLKDTTRRPEWGSNPDPESEVFGLIEANEYPKTMFKAKFVIDSCLTSQ